LKKLAGEQIAVRDLAVMVGSKERVARMMPAKSGKVTLTVPKLPAGQRVWLKIAAEGQGCFSSRDELLVRKK